MLLWLQVGKVLGILENLEYFINLTITGAFSNF